MLGQSCYNVFISLVELIVLVVGNAVRLSLFVNTFLVVSNKKRGGSAAVTLDTVLILKVFVRLQFHQSFEQYNTSTQLMTYCS